MKKAILAISTLGLLLVLSSSCANLARAHTKGDSVKVMTFNVLHGGTQLGQPLSQTAKVIQAAKADVVGVQEVGKNAEKLAQLLGWNYESDHGRAILTRYEIVEHCKGGIKVKLDSGQEVYCFNLHLRSAPYQPYQLLSIPYGGAAFIKTEQEAIDCAEKARGEQIAVLLKQVSALPDKDVPVLVTGDFNEPSHRDWTEAAAKSGRHPIKVAYPHSMAMANAGLVDAWRAVYPDEIRKPGSTWSPVTLADDPKDHHDRIDFVYFKGKELVLNDVKIVGEKSANADIVVSPYPSDHRAVVASFTVTKKSN